LRRKLPWKQQQPFFRHGRHRCDDFSCRWVT
jgi:hypothetical protein